MKIDLDKELIPDFEVDKELYFKQLGYFFGEMERKRQERIRAGVLSLIVGFFIGLLIAFILTG